MNLLNIEHIHKVFGEKVIFDDVSFGVHEGDKIGIIGINGTGKSTLLKIIAGVQEADGGQIVKQNGLRIAYLAQNPDFPEDAKAELLELGREYFAENEIAMETRAFWWPTFEKTVDWLVGAERNYRPQVREVHSEVEGSFSFEAPAGKFTITAKADRVDEMTDGKINVIDYKTGYARSVKEVEGGYAPQLPIEGLIAKFGGFQNISAAEVGRLIYWQLGRQETVIENNMNELLDKSYERIVTLASVFDFEKTAYISQPNPKQAPKYSDYEHLARVREWSVTENEE